MTGWRARFPWTARLLDFLWPDGPARRKRWLRMAIGVMLVIGAHAGLTGVLSSRTSRAERHFVARWGPLDMATHRPAPVDEAANAARAVLSAAKLVALPTSPVDAAARLHEKFAAGTEGDLTAADREVIQSVVRTNALALSILDEAAARPGSNWEIHYEWGIEAEIPPLLDILQLAKLNAAAGRLAVEEGRIEDALAAVRRGAVIARSLEAEPIVIVQLVRLAVTRLDARLVRLILGRLEAGPERLTTMAALISDDQPRQRTQQAMLAEAKALTGMFGGRAGAARVAGREPNSGSALNSGILRAVARPFLLEEERVWLERMSGRIARLDVPRHARSTQPPEPRLRSWDVVVRVIESNTEAVIDRADLAEARSGLARVAIAIERHRAERGHAPAALAELIPEYLAEPPLDPWTGRPFAFVSDGAGWRLRSEADGTAMRSEGVDDPVLDWSRPLTLPTGVGRPSRPS